MIDPGYCLNMARYNAWQNGLMKSALEQLDDTALRADRGAFFGSILKTINHLLWGDMTWTSRFDDGEGPGIGIGDSPSMTPSFAAWSAERFRMDGRILRWAEKVSAVDLKGDLVWVSGSSGKSNRKPKALCVMQLFNHQTHHRGQVHAMCTAAGGMGWVTDLQLMPEQGGWL
ncbi:MAG: DinB family protein [Thalassovita sp.]|nr:DinB family protein [Thalassovita sp.]